MKQHNTDRVLGPDGLDEGPWQLDSPAERAELKKRADKACPMYLCPGCMDWTVNPKGCDDCQEKASCPADCHEQPGLMFDKPAMLFISDDDGYCTGYRYLSDDELDREAQDADTWHGDVTTASASQAFQDMAILCFTMAQALCQPSAIDLPTPSPRHPGGNVRKGGTPDDVKAAEERARWGWKRGEHETSKR